MAYGLKTWNASGVLTVDISDRLTRYVGAYYFNLPANTVTTTLSLPGAESSTYFAFVNSLSQDVYATMGADVININRTNFTTGAVEGIVNVFRI